MSLSGAGCAVAAGEELTGGAAVYRKKASGWLKHLDFILLDALCLQGAFLLAYAVRMGPSSPYRDGEYRGIGLLLLLSGMVTVLLSETFSGVLRRGRYEEFTAMLRQALLVEAVVIMYLFTAQKSVHYSRFIIYLTGVLYLCGGYFARSLWKAVLARRRKAAAEQRSLLIVTEAAMAGDVLERALAREYDRFRVTGIAVTDRDLRGSSIWSGTGPEGQEDESPECGEPQGGGSRTGGEPYGSREERQTDAQAFVEKSGAAQGRPEEARAVQGGTAGAGQDGRARSGSGPEGRSHDGGPGGGRGIPVVACRDDIVGAVCRRWVDEVLIVQPQGAPHPGELVADLAGMGVVVHLGLFDSGEEAGMRQFVGHVGDYTVLTTSIGYATPLQQFAKRAMDIAGGLAGCLATGVLFLVLAPAILVTSPGPVFFMQERIGRNGKRFRIYKFRSMYTDAEARKQELLEKNRVEGGLMFKMEADPRIIGCKVMPDGTVKKGFGNFIRDHSLDEFPQFLNVLKGDMSLVGTRPPTPDEWERYEPHHRARMAVRPGITGLWQVSGRSRITDFEEVVRLDTKYITEWSMGLDFRILLKTVKVVLGKDGAM